MSDKLKGVLAAVVIVACLTLLGFMVHQKADGAAIAAVAVVTTLIGYFTRQPDKKDPPSGVVAVAGVLSIIAAMASCRPEQREAVENAAAVAQYEALLDDCKERGKTAGSYAVYEACANAVDRQLCAESGVRCKDGGL